MRRLALPLGLLAVLSVAGQDQPPPRLDAHGDPLPPGAVFRLGTTRFRHGGLPTGVAWLDNATLLSGGGDGVLRVWEVPSGRQLREIPDATVGYGPLVTDGKVILSVARDYQFAAWDARSGQLLRKFGSGYSSRGAAFRGDTFVFGNESAIDLWDIDDAKPRRHFARDGKRVNGVAWADDGRLVAGAVGDTIHLWDAASGTSLGSVTDPGEQFAFALAFSPGKPTWLASSWGDHTSRLHDVATGEELARWQGVWASSVAFSPDGRLLALGGKANEDGIRLVEVPAGRVVRQILVGPRHNAVQALAFSPDGRYLAAAGIDAVVQVFEVATGRALHPAGQPEAELRDMALSADGKWLVGGGWGLDVHVWDAATGQLRGRVPFEKAGVPAGFDKAGRVLIGRCDKSFEATFCWHDVVTGKDETVVRVPQSIHTVAVTGDDTLVVLTTTNGGLSIWDLARAKEVAAPERHPEAESYYGLALSPDGKRLCTSGVVRDVATGGLVRVLRPGHGTTVYGVAFAPDGRQVATVSAREVRLFDAEGDAPPRVLELPPESGRCVAFHPAGRLLAVGERGGVALHDRATGRVVHRFAGHRGLVAQVLFSPDGGRLYSAGADSTILVWDIGVVR